MRELFERLIMLDHPHEAERQVATGVCVRVTMPSQILGYVNLDSELRTGHQQHAHRARPRALAESPGRAPVNMMRTC